MTSNMVFRKRNKTVKVTRNIRVKDKIKKKSVGDPQARHNTVILSSVFAHTLSPMRVSNHIPLSLSDIYPSNASI